jgi:hypothetical protein
MDYITKLPAFQAPPRPGLFDRLLRLALRLVSFSPALQVRILNVILRRERQKRGFR